MIFFFQYLLRLSISFAVMYLFYAMFLRRLTFYTHNRWYLMGYSLLCFIIPMINIPSLSSALQQNEAPIINTTIVHMIPDISITAATETQLPRRVDVYQVIAWILFTGISIMLLRLLMQLLAYKKLAGRAKIISNNNSVKLYHIDKDTVPFSFGNSIFINQNLYDEAALKEILQHELAHVKQKHTIDILWGEILCALNWYNPFVWLIRKAIRVNLEFIADDKVVQSGTNKQAYQYLLLQVMGNNNLSITNNFNFSSLKKRITMMNKIKSAKIHLVKFLFLIPLLGLLLVSFRDVIKTSQKPNNITVSGVVVNAQTYQPLSNVLLADSINHVNVIADDKGFYSFKITPDNGMKWKYSLSITKEGFENFVASASGIVKNEKAYSVIANMGLSPLNTARSDVNPFAATSNYTGLEASYEDIMKELRRAKQDFEGDASENANAIQIEKEAALEGLVVIQKENAVYIFKSDGWNSYDMFNPMIYVDGKLMTIDEINAAYSKKDV
ncbi:M56 family metallopeptidase, partial [Parafilimonas sp.]|uniref:M56 family metallopeptidase n=1 Tax=Parafilimonas sp. TaxID=1969739 RepID=UPI0039E35CCF